MADDPEATAMQQLTQSLTPLDEPARERILEWALKRCGSAIASVAVSERITGQISAQRPVAAKAPTTGLANGAGAYADFADLYDAANPKTDHMKALVGGTGCRCVAARRRSPRVK